MVAHAAVRVEGKDWDECQTKVERWLAVVGPGGRWTVPIRRADGSFYAEVRGPAREPTADRVFP